MLFSRFASYIVSFASLAILATASALPEELAEKKRQAGSATDVISTLQSQVNTILPQISALDPGSVSSASAVAPLVAQLSSAISSATASLGTGGLVKRADNPQEVADQLASITTNIANTFGPFKHNPHFIIFGGLIAEIDFALKGLLFQVSILVDGVVVLLSGLLVDVAVVLQGLGFTLTLTLLGLL